MVCPVCKRKYYDDPNMVSISETGRCSACDHVEGEVLEDKLREYLDD